VRQGGREERSREVQVPLSDALAAAVAQRTAADAAERAHIKRLTLQVGCSQLLELPVRGVWCAPGVSLNLLGDSLASRRRCGAGLRGGQQHCHLRRWPLRICKFACCTLPCMSSRGGFTATRHDPLHAG